MKRRISWSDAARSDLRLIRQWISRDSRIYATRLLRRIRLKVDGVRQFPEAASHVVEIDNESIREIYEGPYRIIFEFDDKMIHVLTVVHGSRLLAHEPEDESNP